MKNLDEEIAYWEAKQSIALTDLKEHFSVTTKSFQPSKIFKSSILSILKSDTVKSKSIGMLIGFLAQKILLGKSESKIKQILSLLVYDASLFITDKYFRNPQTPKK
jgi:hypothetical protein